MRPLIVPFFIPHAGCPHQCAYCNQRLTTRQTLSLPQAEQIQRTVLEWTRRSTGRPVEVAFFGGSFTLLPMKQRQQLLESVQPLLDQGLVNGIRISTRPDGLCDAILSFLAEYRVSTIEIGVQSLDNGVLKQSDRGHTATDSIAAIMRVARAGFHTGAQLLPGLPGDTPDKALASLSGVMAAGAGFVRIYPALVLAGTRLAGQYAAGDWQPPALDATIRLCARMLLMAQKAGIPVIRLGLQSDEGLVAGETVLAGPWHPAMGQLARGELYYALVSKLADQLGEPLEQIVCHTARISDVIGHKRRNLSRWQQRGLPAKQVVAGPGLEPEEVMVQSRYKRMKGSIIANLNDKEILDA